MGNLTLADCVGCLIDKRKPYDQFKDEWWPSSDVMFHGFFHRLDIPTPERTAILHIVERSPRTKALVRGKAITLLRSQFPSLKRAPKVGSYVMNERDYALMKVFFGGEHA